MPIQGKTTNIGASDINNLRGTPNQTVSFGNIANTWFGGASNVSVGNDFTDTFTGNQFGSTIEPPNLTDDPLDWYHRGTYCSGDQMAASSDGQRIAISRNGFGVSIMVWNGSSWVPETTITRANITYTGPNPFTFSSVALNSDGTTLAMGYSYYTSTGSIPLPGAVAIFTRSGSTWTQQGFVIPSGYTTGTYSTNGPNAGGFDAIALSSDGNTLAVGGPYDNGNQNPNSVSTSEGAVYIFTRSGSTWSQQARLTSTCRYGSIVASYDQKMGYSVGLSSDGNTLVTGGPFDSATWGVLLVFTRSGSTWSQQYRLENNGTTYGAYWGNSTAISPDGNTICATWVNYSASPTNYQTVIFTRSAGVWTQQQQFMEVDNRNNGANKFADNNTLIVAGVAVYTRSGSTWTKAQSLFFSGVNVGQTFQVAPYSAVTSPSSFFITSTDTSYPGSIQYSLSGSSVNQTGNAIFIKPTILTPSIGFGSTSINFNRDTIYVTEQTYRPNGAVTIINNGILTETQLPTKLSGEVAFSADGKWMVTADLTAASPVFTNVGRVNLHANVNGNWVWQSSFQPTDVGTNQAVWFGRGLVMSGDGSTVAVLAQYDGTSSSNGSPVYLLTRTGSTLTQQGRFSGPGTNGYSDSIGSIAISADGNTVAAGYRQYGGGIGFVKVFSRSNGVWSLQTDISATRLGAGASTLYFGSSVALSGDGNTLAIGAPYDTPPATTSPTVGTVNIYTRSGSTWSKKAAIQGTSTNAYLGTSVSLSGDGYTMLSSTPLATTPNTTAFIFRRQSTTGDVWVRSALNVIIPNNYGFGNNASNSRLDRKGKTAVIGFGQTANGVMIFK